MSALRRIVMLGTGTGVGKTWVGAALVSSWARTRGPAFGQKPLESGIGEGQLRLDESDAAVLDRATTAALRAAAVHRALHAVVLSEPLSPHLAARRANVRFDLERLIEWTLAGEVARLERWKEQRSGAGEVGSSMAAAGGGAGALGDSRAGGEVGSSAGGGAGEVGSSVAAAGGGAGALGDLCAGGEVGSSAGGGAGEVGSSVAAAGGGAGALGDSRAGGEVGRPLQNQPADGVGSPVVIDGREMTPHVTSLEGAAERGRGASGAVLSLVETAGGACSPMTEAATNLDFARALGDRSPGIEMRVVLVAPDRLGVLHDVAATLHAAAAAQVPIERVVLSAPSAADDSSGSNAAELARVVFPRLGAAAPRVREVFVSGRGADDVTEFARQLAMDYGEAHLS